MSRGQELTRAEVVLGARDRELQSALGRAQRTMTSVGARMARVATRIGQAITAALGAAGVAAVKFASDFEAEMTKLETLVGISREQVQKWNGDLQRIATTTGQALPELSRAMFAITSGGLRGSEALDTLLQSAKAAAIGLGDVRSIGRTATAALQAFGDQGLTARDAIDQMVATVRAGNLEASDLAGSLGRVMGIASSLGVRFADLNAFVATFTRLGTSAEESVTSLRAILQGLTGVNKQAAEAFERLEIPMEKVRRQIREEGLVQGLRTMIEAADGNIETLTELVPNIRALAGFLGTAGAQAQEFARIQRDVRHAMGLTNEGFERTQQTLSNMIARLREIIRVGLTQIGVKFLPELKSLARFLENNMGRAFAAVIGAIGDLVETIRLADARIRNSFFGKVMGLSKTPESEALARIQEMKREIQDLETVLLQMTVRGGPLSSIGRSLQRSITGRNVGEVTNRMHALAGEIGRLQDQVTKGPILTKLRELEKRLRDGLGGAAQAARPSVKKLREDVNELGREIFEMVSDLLTLRNLAGETPEGEGEPAPRLPTGAGGLPVVGRGGAQTFRGAGFNPEALQRFMANAGAESGKSFSDAMGDTLKRGARSAMESLIRGLLQGRDDLEDVLINIGISIASTLLTQGLFSGLNIASPSGEGVFAGRMLGEGIVVGIRGMLPDVRMASDELAAAAVPGAGGGINLTGPGSSFERENLRPVEVLPTEGLRPHEESVVARSAQRIRQHVRDRDFRKLTGADRD